MTNKKSKKSHKLHLAENENLLAKLHEIVRNGRQNSEVAQSLISWYMDHKGWTPKQASYAKALTKKKKAPRKEKKFYLYAIKSNELINIGYSCDISKRIKQIQVASLFKPELLWKYYVGKLEEEAGSHEKKLHRFCDKYHIRGKWYESSCMILVEQFSPRESISRDYAAEKNDIKLINNSPI